MQIQYMSIYPGYKPYMYVEITHFLKGESRNGNDKYIQGWTSHFTQTRPLLSLVTYSSFQQAEAHVVQSFSIHTVFLLSTCILNA